MTTEEINKLAECRKLVMRQLGENGVTCAVTYSGSGDDGAIDEVIFLKVGDIVGDKEGDLRDCKGLIDAINVLAYHFLTVQGLDWCNDDGGNGTLTIDSSGKVYVETSIANTEYEEYENSYDMTQHLIQLKLGVEQ